jgi:hypothetical protein
VAGDALGELVDRHRRRRRHRGREASGEARVGRSGLGEMVDAEAERWSGGEGRARQGKWNDAPLLTRPLGSEEREAVAWFASG